jgi:transposase
MSPDYIGIDVHKLSSQVCILTSDGELLERRIKTDRVNLEKMFAGRTAARILIEASTESEWVARCLEELGHEVIVADPNFAPMYATRSKKVKTDKRDARTLCEACRLGAYRPAHRTSDKQRRIRARLAVRDTLVRTRAKYMSLIGALARREGCRIPTGYPEGFVARVEKLELPESLVLEVTPLLLVMKTLNEQIKEADRKLAQIVKEDAVVNRLCSVPGVGPVTAVTYVATLGEVSRFGDAKQVRAYLGLVPKEDSSGERCHRGKITKAGNSRARWVLVEAAWVLLRTKKPETEALRQWALAIAQRRGKRIAAVALARRLGGILYALWRDGTRFDPEAVRGTGKLLGQPQAA